MNRSNTIQHSGFWWFLGGHLILGKGMTERSIILVPPYMCTPLETRLWYLTKLGAHIVGIWYFYKARYPKFSMFKLSPREPWSFLDAIPCHWPDNWPRVTGPTTGHGRREAVAGEKHPMQGIWHSAHPDVTLAESGVPRTPFFLGRL